MRMSIGLAGLSGMVAVALGAFAAHGMAGEDMAYARELVEKGAHYQLVHAVAIVAVAVFALVRPNIRLLAFANAAFLLGTLLFCGSLYAIAFSNIRAFGMVAPLGGISFMAGWLMVAIAGFKAVPVHGALDDAA
ncbi:DUF423 domain-containing protein [Thalassospira marina]|uniref:DUF423 domain-containing protein n=1 Tax=Thalassospira marina TaxID=2048283 RepID=A0ABM6Q8B5_9PROT|nr:DUF423 domain-containing protein [Thalassospira marina]AUG52751.1 hypothetical protein CSC3H3_08550 [Thalassospira marina]